MGRSEFPSVYKLFGSLYDCSVLDNIIKTWVGRGLSRPPELRPLKKVPGLDDFQAFRQHAEHQRGARDDGGGEEEQDADEVFGDVLVAAR